MTQALAYWGALLSTLLAGLKLLEFWDNRFKISISFLETGSQQEGNTLTIRNLTFSRQILIGYEIWESKSIFPFTHKKYFSVLEWDSKDRIIEARSSISDNFCDEHHFSTNNECNLYIKLYFAGKRPVTKKIS